MLFSIIFHHFHYYYYYLNLVCDDTTNEYRETLSTIVPEFISTGVSIVKILNYRKKIH